MRARTELLVLRDTNNASILRRESELRLSGTSASGRDEDPLRLTGYSDLVCIYETHINVRHQRLMAWSRARQSIGDIRGTDLVILLFNVIHSGV
jgi:hypothetical protein